MRFLKYVFSFLLLICLPALFLWKLTIAGRILVGLDPFNFFYPYHDAVAAALNLGQLPEWNPALFGGVPFLADSQAQLFYPLSWPFLSWLAPDALTWGLVLHLALAALGTYLWARRGLGMGHVGAWVAGAVFTLSGYLGAQVEHLNQVQAAAWLPWLLLGYEWGRGMPHRNHGSHTYDEDRENDDEAAQKANHFLATQRMFGVVLGSFALAMSLLAGQSQTTFLLLVMLGLRALRSAIRDDERTRANILIVQRSGLSATVVKAAWRNFIGVNFVPLIIIVIIGLLLAAIQLVPTQQLSTLSQRAGGLSYLETVSFSFDPLIIPRALLPTFGQDAHLLSEYVGWVGFIALMLAIIGLIGEYLPWGTLLARPTRASRDFGFLAVFTGLFLSFGLYNPVYWLLWRVVPGFSLFRAPARWLLLWAFGAAILAGVGLERLYHASRRSDEADEALDPDGSGSAATVAYEKRRQASTIVTMSKSSKQSVIMKRETGVTAILLNEDSSESSPSTLISSDQKADSTLLLPEGQEKKSDQRQDSQDSLQTRPISNLLHDSSTNAQSTTHFDNRLNAATGSSSLTSSKNKTIPFQPVATTVDLQPIITIPLSTKEDQTQKDTRFEQRRTESTKQDPLLLPSSDIEQDQTEQEKTEDDDLLLPANSEAKIEDEREPFVDNSPFTAQKIAFTSTVSEENFTQESSAINQTENVAQRAEVQAKRADERPEQTQRSFMQLSGLGRRSTQVTLLIGLLLLLAALSFGAWPSLDILPWWIGASGAGLLVLVSRPLWRNWFPISYPTFVVVLMLFELWLGASAQDYQQATAPEAYNGLRPAPAHLMTAKPVVGAARILSLSNLTWDPGDLKALQERHATLLDEKPIYDLVVVTKLKEVLAPNQPMRWGIQTADGYGGGLLPSSRWVSFQKTLPLAKLVPDGRLREQLTGRPRPELLDVMGVEWVIVDKVNDWWSENIFHDLGASVTLKAGDIQADWLIPSPDGTWSGTDISWIVFGEWPATPGTITLDGQTFSLSEAEERATRETWRGTERHMLLRLNEPIRFKDISLRADAEWNLGGISLVDSRLPGFQPLPADASVRTVFSGDVTIYQRLESLGRAWIVPNAVPVETIDAAASFVADPAFDPRESVIIEHDTSTSLPTGGTGDVTWLHDDPGDLRLVVTVPEGGWLVLADAPFPGWQAIVDGQAVEWQAANVINRTLYLQPGKHTVTWRYYTPGLLAGLIGTLFGVILLIVWVIYALRRT